jgi:hypothetical protein
LQARVDTTLVTQPAELQTNETVALLRLSVSEGQRILDLMADDSEPTLFTPGQKGSWGRLMLPIDAESMAAPTQCNSMFANTNGNAHCCVSGG